MIVYNPRILGHHFLFKLILVIPNLAVPVPNPSGPFPFPLPMPVGTSLVYTFAGNTEGSEV